MATLPSILAWIIPWGCKESDMTEQITHSLKQRRIQIQIISVIC